MLDFIQGLYQASLVPVVTLGWPLSTLDLIILAFNLTCVYLVGRNSILNYPVGLVAITAYMFMCFSLGFYSEFFLQVYFFIASLVGWYMWRNRGHRTLEPKYIGIMNYILVLSIWFTGTVVLGDNIDWFFQSFVELISPVLTLLNGDVPIEYVHTPASYPYWDAFTTVGQVLAMILMVRKAIESWFIWITIDVVSVPLFYAKGGYGVSIMFFFFTFLAAKGLYEWMKLYKEQNTFKSPISHLHS